MQYTQYSQLIPVDRVARKCRQCVPKLGDILPYCAALPDNGRQSDGFLWTLNKRRLQVWTDCPAQWTTLHLSDTLASSQGTQWGSKISAEVCLKII